MINANINRVHKKKKRSILLLFINNRSIVIFCTIYLYLYKKIENNIELVKKKIVFFLRSQHTKQKT